MKQKPFVLILFLALAALPALHNRTVMAAPAAAVPKARTGGLRLLVKNISSGQEVSDHDWGLVKIEAGVETDRAPAVGRGFKSAHSVLKVKVDGKEVSCSLLGSRTGYEGKKAFTYRTLGIPFGSTPGRRTITISLGRLSKTLSVSYRPGGQLGLCGLYDDQALFGRGDVTIEWLGCYVLRESVKAFVNGKEVPVEAGPVEGRPELVGGQMRLRDMLVTGTNMVRIEAVDVKGDKRQRELRLHYYPENRVRVGDLFVLNLGLGEPKAGPFYDAVVDGGGLVKKEDLTEPPGPERMGGQVVMPAGRVVLARFQAVAEGESIISTRERQYLIDPPQEVEHVRVLVSRGPGPFAAGQPLAPAGPALPAARPTRVASANAPGATSPRRVAPDKPPAASAEASTSGFEGYTGAGLFACTLPRGWYRIENPGKDQHIFGVSAYGPALGEQAGLKLSVEFYAADNLLGFQTAERFTQGLAKKGLVGPKDGGRANSGSLTVAGRPAKVLERELGLEPKNSPSFGARIPVLERVVVVPAEGGFYVLQFRAPVEGLEKNNALFAAVLDSFQPGK